MKRSLLLSVLAALSALPLPCAQAQAAGDAQPMDPAQLLQALKQLREMNETGIKNRRNSAYQQVAAAVASPEKAVAFWKEAVKNAQFEGAEKQGAQLRDWREGDGDALNDKLCMGAAHLHLRWLALTLQHSAGYETKQLLPQIIEFTKAALADEQAAIHFTEQLEKAREKNDGKHGMKKPDVAEDAVVKRVHDQIMRTAVGQSSIARWLQLGDLLGDDGKKQKPGATANSSWESVPGNVDGIYNNIILPEFRAAKDPRLLEYWDMYLRRETDRAAERKLDVEQRDWVQVKRPTILWGRAQDVLLLGFRNRAIGDMFNVVKTFPQHPEAPGWITQIEALLTSPGLSETYVRPPATAPVGTVPPPVAVPPAVAPQPPGSVPGVRR